MSIDLGQIIKTLDERIGPHIRDKNYVNVHVWLRYHYGSANKCENPDCSWTGKFRYEWALKRGYTYEKNRDNFIQLCTSCHRHYDMTENKIETCAQARRDWYKKEGVKEYIGKIRRETGQNINGRIVLQFTMDGELVKEWISTIEASRQLGVVQSAIASAATNKYPSAGGFKWAYKDQYNDNYKFGETWPSRKMVRK